MTHEEAFYIGYITKTKGLKGEVQLFFEFEDYEDLELEVLFADLNGKLVPFFVSSYKVYPNSTGLLFFDDIDHIDKAQALIKKKIYLPLEKMPERAEDEFGYMDLKGFTVTDKTLGVLGLIKEVNEYPQQYVATVLFKEIEILIPLSEDFILEIDAETQYIKMDLPEGLIAIYVES